MTIPPTKFSADKGTLSVQAYIPKDLYQLMKIASREWNESYSVIITDALEHYFSLYPPEACHPITLAMKGQQVD